MKAELKINYNEEFKKGTSFTIVEIKGKRITLRGSNNNVDFGFSEVNIIEGTSSNLFYLGQFIAWEYSNGNGLFKTKERNLCIKTALSTGLPTTKEILNKALTRFLDN